MIPLLNNRKAIIILDQLVFSGASFMITILMAGILSINDFGKYAGYVLSIYLIVSILSAFVIQPFQVFQGNVNDLKAYTSFTFWFQLVAIGVLTLIALGLKVFFPGFYPWTLLGFSTGFLLHDFGRKILLALNRPRQTFILDATTALCSMLALYVFTSFLYQSLNNLFAVLSLAYLASFILLVVFIKPINLNPKRKLAYLREHWDEGKWLFFTALSQWWSGNLFVVASALYLGPLVLGALRLAQSLMGVLNVLLQTFENYVLPQTALKINVEVSDALAYVTGVSRKAALLFIPTLCLIYIFAEKILVLAGGPAYEPFAFALRGISMLYVLIFLSQPIRLMIRSLQLNQHFFYGYLITLIFALLFAHSLLSSYGLTGAIAGLAISQLLLMTYWTIILQRKKIYIWKSFISY
jgi:O-antigen/teichoic acid export membrane protein